MAPQLDPTNPAAPGTPFINLDALATNPQHAVRLAHRATAAFIGYLDSQQDAAGIPQPQRVTLQIVHEPKGATLAGSRKYTVAIVLFLVALIAAVALAYVLENLRPRVRPLSVPVASEAGGAPVRAAETSRSA